MSDLYLSLSFIVGAFFLWAGCLNVFGPQFVRDEFRDWGYPQILRMAVGLAEWLISICLLIQIYPRAAILGACLILFAVIYTFIRHRQFMRIELSLVFLGLLASIWPHSPALGLAGF